MSERRRITDENWAQANWRSWMGWQYMIVCLFDFMIAPIMSWIFAYYTNTPLVSWVPLTMTGAGFYHLAMGAIIGVTSFSKSKEKIAALSRSAQPTEQELTK